MPKKKYINVLVHILLWLLLGFILLMYPPLTGGMPLPDAFWIRQSANFILLIGLFYANALYLVPAFLLKNRIALFICWICVATMLTSLLAQKIEDWLGLQEQMRRILNISRPEPKKYIDFFMMMTTLLVLGISSTIASIQHWQRDQQLRQIAEKQQVVSELSFLKAQINPHFFFNTLNNIYALTYVEVESSRQALHKLSRMMRYLLYETQNDTTLLSKEIAFIKDYIELMQLRLNDNVTVEFSEPYPFSEKHVAPMLFLPFVENAFKHGISSSHQSLVSISLRQNGEDFSLQVSNKVFTEPAPLVEGQSGIGLLNTKRRLDLLYPGKYHLETGSAHDPDKFIVTLDLNLS